MFKPYRRIFLGLAGLYAGLASAQVAGSIAVYPTVSSIELGSTRQFSAYVPISPNTVTWAVNNIIGGNAMVGTVTPTGFYTPPPVAPAPNVVTIKVTSTAYPSSAGTATLTITKKYPWLWSVSPNSIPVGAYEVSFNGANFTAESKAIANGVAVPTTYVSPTKVIAKGTAAQVGPLVFAVQQPAPGAVTGNTVTAQVVSAPTKVTVSPGVAAVQLSNTVAFTATVTGNQNTAVTWSVNNVVGGSAALGTITPAGQYTAPAAMPSPSTVSVRATSVAVSSAYGQANVTITAPNPNPNPNPTPTPVPQGLLTAGRFLEQSSFGPNNASLIKVQQMGIPAYLDEQFALPDVVLSNTWGSSMGALRTWMLNNYSTAPDQLRQRVAYSLGQIIVTSNFKLIYPDEMIPWLNLLNKHAFGNYKNLLKDISMCPSMGKFLDIANSFKPGLAGGANENYPRELMQLFSIGLWKLNMDGSQQLDPNGQPIPVYDQNTVKQVALAFTGWTYPTKPGANPNVSNWEYFIGPMEPRQQFHDVTAKSFLGCNLPANQTMMQDLDGTIDCIYNHPNVPPFIATRLIRSMVTSNPSPAFIQRIANVFADNGLGQRGDLKAVVKAILLDAEARQDAATINHGRLKEPILGLCGFLRALNGNFSSTNQIAYLFDNMAQSILGPPSVFNWFSPLYRIPKSPLFGPEFQIYTPTEATIRGNFMYQMFNYPSADAPIDLSPFQPYGNDMAGLVDTADRIFLYGRMPAAMKQAIMTAAAPGYDAKARIETVIYLTVISGQYSVQY